MKKQKAQLPIDHGLKAEIEQAIFLANTKSTYSPPPVLSMLSRMLIKNKRIAQVLGISPALVSAMLTGKQACPPKYEPKLFELLRFAVSAAKQSCDKAEKRELLYKNTQFPAEAIRWYREKITEAEKILATENQQ